MALALTANAGCRERPPAAPLIPPLGPGPIVTVQVPGAAAIEPAIAARPPLVAVAFGTRDSRGPLAYLATSSDNGATFSEPQPVTGGETAERYDDLRLSFTHPDESARGTRPALMLEWTRPDGRPASLTLQPWSRQSSETAQPAPVRTGAALIASCSANGEASLAGTASAASVPINHSLPDEACVPGEVVAVTDSRRWIHAAWIGGHDAVSDRRVFHASSPHGNGFGFAQVVADGRAGASHLRVVTDPNETIVTVWDQKTGSQREVWLRQLIPSHFGPGTLLPLTRLSGPEGGEVPALAGISGGVIAAWVVPSTGSLAIRRVGLDAVCAEPPALHAAPEGATESSENRAETPEHSAVSEPRQARGAPRSGGGRE